MKKFFIFLIFLIPQTVLSQDISGFWQGVLYAPGSAASAYWGILMSIDQNGNVVSGKLYSYIPNQEYFFLEVEMSGNVQNNEFQLTTGKILRDSIAANQSWCLNGTGKLTYDPAKGSLTGKVAYGNCAFTAQFELYILKPTSRLRYCQGEEVALEVTGKDVRWYDSAAKSQLLGRGNTIRPKITQTTTFYATQTHYDRESPATPVTVEISNLAIDDLDVQPARCGQNNGSIQVLAKGSVPLTFSLGSQKYQAGNRFDNLPAGNYTLTAKDSLGCTASRNFEILSKTDANCTNAFYLPTSFSPNGDGTNDTFAIYFPANTVKIHRFAVYNRWGNYVFGFGNSVDAKSGEVLWDGKIGGAEPAQGAYQYVLEIEFENGEKFVSKNAVILLK